MAVAMVAMLAFGGTYAFFTATATTASETVKTGYVKLAAGSNVATVITKDSVLPGSEILTANLVYTVDTTDAAGNYVAIKITLTTGDDTKDAALKLTDMTPGSAWTSAGDGVYYIATAVKDGETATIDAEKFVIPTTVQDDWSQKTDSAANGLMDIDITVKIEARSIQVSGTSSVTDAIALLSWEV